MDNEKEKKQQAYAKYGDRYKNMPKDELLRQAASEFDKKGSGILKWIGIVIMVMSAIEFIVLLFYSNVPLGVFVLMFFGCAIGFSLILASNAFSKLSDIHKMAIEVEIEKRGIQHLLHHKEREMKEAREENKAMLVFLAIVLVLVVLVGLGFRACTSRSGNDSGGSGGSGGSVICPKCGSGYRTNHSAGEFIIKYGRCPYCD